MNGVQGTGRVFLDLQDEDFSSLQPADLTPFGKMENILANYRSLECSVCRRHFGYVHRMDSRIILCAAPCLTVASNKLKSTPLGQPSAVFTKPLQQARLVDSAKALTRKPAIEGTVQREINALPSVIHAECMEAVTKQFNGNHDVKKGLKNGYSNGESSNLGPEERIDQHLSSKASDVIAAPKLKLPAVELARQSNGKAKPDDENVRALQSRKSRIDGPKPSTSTVTKVVMTPPNPKIWTKKDIKVSPNLKDGARVYPSFSTTPSTFILRAEDDEKKVEKMQIEMTEYCESSPPMTRMPSVDEVVFALYGDTFYRGVVVGLKPEESMIQIEFFDDGDSTCVKLADCREASDSIMKKHPVSYGVLFECDMTVRCPDTYEPSDELQNLIQDVSILKIKSEGNGRILGSLAIPSLPGKTVNELLEQEIVKDSSRQDNKEKAVSQVVPEGKQPGAAGENGSTKARSVDQTSERRRQTRPTFLNVPLSENVTKGARVHINFIWDYRRMSVSSVKDDDNFALLQEQIAEYIPKAPAIGTKLDQDDLVLAPYRGGETYYRASVSKVDEAGVHVYFVDYGDDAILPVKVLRELNCTIANHPIYGMEWRMAGLPRRFKAGFEAPELASVHQGVIEVTKQNMDYWKGVLRLDNGKSWNEIVLSKLEAKGRRH